MGGLWKSVSLAFENQFYTDAVCSVGLGLRVQGEYAVEGIWVRGVFYEAWWAKSTEMDGIQRSGSRGALSRDFQRAVLTNGSVVLL